MSDEQIIELIKSEVHSGTEQSVEQTASIDNAFKKGTLTWKNIHEMFLRGKNGVYGYYGGRWVISKLQHFQSQYPQYGTFKLN